uniref:RNI-like protein n=1 Tax=Panagrolaimus davidi TaxID=227884 RepID=A0A914P8Y2_9BILA
MVFSIIDSQQCVRLFTNPAFGHNLTELDFYLSDQITDEVLDCLASATSKLRRISIVECQNVTDLGIISATIGQRNLRMLELRNLRTITSEAFKYVSSPHLSGVDLSGCTELTSEGIFYLVHQNPSIRCLYLNHCRNLDDQALYDIAQCIGENLHILELDFLPNMTDPARTLHQLSQRCPKISQLSLCNFFDSTESAEDEELPECRIEGQSLDYVDLCGNYFQTLPDLPASVRTIRLSVSGSEDVVDLIARLIELPLLKNIHLELIAPGQDWRDRKKKVK